jgi:3-deoxy-7-phosphoheptulonate synthase
MAEGNYQIVLCERGIRTFAQHTRNTMDLAAIPAVRRISHLPVIVDPSHGNRKELHGDATRRALELPLGLMD